MLRRMAATILMVFASSALADDLSGSDRFVCSSTQVTVCTPDGVCEAEFPQSLGIPQFVLVDLKSKQLATTRASGENRSTPILHQAREGGQVTLQGVQGGRAFSMVISEATGFAAIAIAMEDLNIGVFGACTPAPVE